MIFFEGRRDTQIKIRGNRVDVSEVDKVVNQLDYVDKAAILVYHSSMVDQTLVAFVTLKNATKTQAEVEADLKSKLVGYMVPHVVILKQFPYLSNGKIDRQELLRMYQDMARSHKTNRSSSLVADVPKEKRDMAKQVFAIVDEALGSELRNAITAKKNFFELGGNSINSVYTVMELRKKGFNISLSDFLRADNLGDVLEKIKVTNDPEGDDSTLQPGMRLYSEPFNHEQKDETMRLIAISFLNKGDLDMWLPGRTVDDYLHIYKPFWDDAINNGLSFTVKNEKGEMVGAVINFDLALEPEFEVPKALIPMFDLLLKAERPVV